jgi:hypothetical protein
MHPATIESRISAVQQAQSVVLIHLATWLRSPSKENRQRLDDSLIACDDVIDRYMCPTQLTKANMAAR